MQPGRFTIAVLNLGLVSVTTGGVGRRGLGLIGLGPRLVYQSSNWSITVGQVDQH